MNDYVHDPSKVIPHNPSSTKHARSFAARYHHDWLICKESPDLVANWVETGEWPRGGSHPRQQIELKELAIVLSRFQDEVNEPPPAPIDPT